MKQAWLSPVFQVWQEIVGCAPARPARLAQCFGPLRVDGQLPPRVIAALRRYLEHQRKTNFAYIKPETFVDTWVAWAPKPPSRYVPPAKIPQPPSPADRLTREQMQAQIAELRAAHPGSPYIATLERMYQRVLAAR